jgi:ribosomal protein L7/L12
MNDLSHEETGRLTDLILAGQKLEAIKQYKEITGMGLRESKEYLASSPKPHRPSMGNIPEEDAKKMTEFIFAGQKIAAIKMYKEATGLGLKESKDIIDALEKQLREECPENFAHAARTGCSVVLVGGLLAFAAATGILGWA